MHVSIDSMYKGTYESIRKGAVFEEVMDNCMYYLDSDEKERASLHMAPLPNETELERDSGDRQVL